MPSWASHSSLRLTARISNQVGAQGLLWRPSACYGESTEVQTGWPHSGQGDEQACFSTARLHEVWEPTLLQAALMPLASLYCKTNCCLEGLEKVTTAGTHCSSQCPTEGLERVTTAGTQCSQTVPLKQAARRPQLNMIRKCYGLAIHS